MQGNRALFVLAGRAAFIGHLDTVID